MTTGMRVGGKDEDSIVSNPYRIHCLWIRVPEQTKKEKVTDRAAPFDAALLNGGNDEQRKTHDRRL